MVENVYKNQPKTSAILPIHIIKENSNHVVIGQKTIRFQINAGKTYRISHKFFMPRNFHLEANSQSSVMCKLENGQLTVPSITFTYIKDSTVKSAARTIPQRSYSTRDHETQSPTVYPVYVTYVDVNNQQAVKNGQVSGNYNQQVNIVDKIKVPLGYDLMRGQQTSFRIKHFPQHARLLVQERVAPEHQANQQPVYPTNAANNKRVAPHGKMSQTHQSLPDFERDLKFYNKKLGFRLLHMVLNHGINSFKKVIINLFNQMGYENANQIRVNPKVDNHHEIDGIINKSYQNRNQASSIYVRACHYQHNQAVNIRDVRDFCTCVIDHYAYTGIFITTSYFNQADRQEAKRHSIQLINGNDLVKLMLKKGIGLRTRRVYRINSIDPHFFEG